MSASATPSVTIVGAGGIGCAVAHALADGGVHVRLVDVNESKVTAGQSDGVTIEGQGSRQAEFISFASWQPSQGEVLFLCTKCYDNAAVLDRLPDDGLLIPIQNGFDPQLQAHCRYEGIASFVSECEADRPVTRITRPGDLHVGACGDAATLPPALVDLVTVLEQHAAFTVKQVNDILPFKHTKLMYNAAISPLAAVTGLDNGQLLTHRDARRLFFAFLRENYAILKQARTPLGVVGPFHPDTVNRILRTPLLGTIMAGPFSRNLKGTYCSMSGDIQAGRTEIDNFNGHLVRLADDQDCPLNQSACRLVSRMADERATPAMHYLDELAA
ncbi:MAG: hypothetical protein MK116_08530 [Phycisphaerales bacterium]|nr:hypothetical protein [Phycisphaerales bacterium]